ncbi:MAG: hypothetical protein JW902_11335 [Syntrophaceae bacterium]|nr:hypothetical protein [Syntrophaceae bacterium]
MRPRRQQLTWIFFIILSISYLMVLHIQGLLRSNPLGFLADIIGPAIGIYVFAEILARLWHKHVRGEKDAFK